MKKMILSAAVLCAVAMPAFAQSAQVQEMRYRAELARQRSQQHAQEARERAYMHQQEEEARRAEQRARSRSH